jgi:hypothetical protein
MRLRATVIRLEIKELGPGLMSGLGFIIIYNSPTILTLTLTLNLTNIGVGISCMHDGTFGLLGFSCAAISNIFFSSR